MSRYAFFTHRKAGSQWIADVLSDYRILRCVPHVRFKRAADSEYELTAFAREEAGVFVAPIFDVSYSIWNTLRSKGDRAIRVGRDPRDAAVSYVYSLAYSHVTKPVISLARAPLLTLDGRRRLMMGAAMLLGNGTGALRSWRAADRSSGCYVSTYERVVDDQEREFAAMFEFLGWPIPGDVLREVVAAHSFTVRSGGRARGEADPFSHYRQGVAGDWRNHFDRELARQFEEAFPHLLVDLGYEDTDVWWESVPVSLPHAAPERGEDALADVMARALQERDERWTRSETAMNERCVRLERAVQRLQGMCDERLALIEEQDRDIRRLQGDAERNMSTINELRLVCEERLVNIGSLHAEGQALREKLRDVTNESAQSREAVGRLQGVCDERLALIEEQDRVIRRLRGDAERNQSTISELRLACEERLGNIKSLHAEAQVLREKVFDATKDADEWREAVRQLQGTAGERLVLLADRERQLAQLQSDAERRSAAMNERCTVLSRAVENLRRICDERMALIEEQAQAISEFRAAQVEAAKATAGDEPRSEADIVDGLSAVLGPGWFGVEFENGIPFRWSRKDATIHVALVHEVRHALALVVEPGPGVRLEPFMLAVALADGTPLTRILVNGRERVSIELPRQAPQIFSIVLNAEDGGATTADDTRVLDFRAFDVRLERADDVFPIWAEPAAGFYAPERDRDRLFRWICGDATIVLSNTRGKKLSFDVESGPGFASQPFTLVVRAADGSEVATAVVGSRVTVDVAIDRSQRFDALTLHADGGGRIVPGDDRVMNFRVFARD